MSFTDKVMFWKKKDPLEIDLDKPADPMPSYPQGMDPSQPPMDGAPQFPGASTPQQDPFAAPPGQQDPFAQSAPAAQADPFAQPAPTFQEQPSSYRDPMGVSLQSQSAPAQSVPAPATSTNDTQLIVAKLETIQASLEHLATRIGNLERSQNERKW